MEISKELLEEIKTYIEAAEVRIDSEFGNNRELDEIIRDDDMPSIYAEICSLLEEPAGVVYTLPIDVGTIVYANTQTLVSLGKWEAVTVGYEVGTVTIRSDNDPEFWAVGDDEGWAGDEIEFNRSDLGNKVFLTREAAEEARKTTVVMEV